MLLHKFLVVGLQLKVPFCRSLTSTGGVQMVGAGERIAQLVIVPFLPVEFKEVNELDETERGDKGFGSTGV